LDGRSRRCLHGRDHPLAIVIWSGELFHTLVGWMRMSGSEWAVILAILNGPAALSGMLAARLLRRVRPSARVAPAAAAIVALGISTGTGLAFGWWLSQVL
jgi:hypothetical protein